MAADQRAGQRAPAGALPGGPAAGPLAQTVALHRDPLGALQRARARHGDVFTLRLTTVRPLVVVARSEDVPPLLAADPHAAHAGEARRRVLPMASPHSVFGSDGDEHRAARGHVAALFTPAAVDAHRAAMAACATRHVAGWPRGRPFRLLPRLRALVDEIFTRVMLGVHDEQRAKEIADGMQRMLRTPGNPPLAIPGEGDGLLGRVGTAVFARKRAPLARLLAAEVASRRARETRADDVLDRMVAAEPTLSDEAIVDELLALLMAAQEPAAAALSWLLERLARRPDLPTSDAVVRETLRLRPAAIAALRRLTSPRDVAGHRLPAGALVMLPIPLLHRDPDAFRHPDDFRPERWAAATEPATYLPFGGGARRCLGEPLARAYLDTIVPAVRERVALRAAWPQPERMVLRGTILVPHRSGLMIGR